VLQSSCFQAAGAHNPAINQLFVVVTSPSPERQLLLRGVTDSAATLSYYGAGAEVWSDIWFFAVNGVNVYQTAAGGDIAGDYMTGAGLTGNSPPPRVWPSASCAAALAAAASPPIATTQQQQTCVVVTGSGVDALNQLYIQVRVIFFFVFLYVHDVKRLRASFSYMNFADALNQLYIKVRSRAPFSYVIFVSCFVFFRPSITFIRFYEHYRWWVLSLTQYTGMTMQTLKGISLTLLFSYASTHLQRTLQVAVSSLRLTQYTGMTTRSATLTHYTAGTESYSDIVSSSNSIAFY
jgi:hypothetical protein